MSVTGAIISLVASAVGTGLQYRETKRQGKLQKAILDRNAQQRELDAETRRQETIAKQHATREAGNKAIERNRMLFLGRGIEVEGSPLELLAEDESNLENQINEIGRAGERDIANLKSGAALDRFKGADVLAASRTAGAATVLSGAASISNQFVQYKVQGVF